MSWGKHLRHFRGGPPPPALHGGARSPLDGRPGQGQARMGRAHGSGAGQWQRGPGSGPQAKPGVGPKGGRERLPQGAGAGRGPDRGVRPQESGRELVQCRWRAHRPAACPPPRSEFTAAPHWRPLIPCAPAQAWLGGLWGALQNLAWPCWLPSWWVRGCKRRPEGRVLLTPPPRSSQSPVWGLRRGRPGSVWELSSQDESGPGGWGFLQWQWRAEGAQGDGCDPDGPGWPWRTGGRTVACHRWELGGLVGQPVVPEDRRAGQGGSGGGRETWRWTGQAGGPQPRPELKDRESKPAGCTGTAGQQGRLRGLGYWHGN